MQSNRLIRSNVHVATIVIQSYNGSSFSLLCLSLFYLLFPSLSYFPFDSFACPSCASRWCSSERARSFGQRPNLEVELWPMGETHGEKTCRENACPRPRGRFVLFDNQPTSTAPCEYFRTNRSGLQSGLSLTSISLAPSIFFVCLLRLADDSSLR